MTNKNTFFFCKVLQVGVTSTSSSIDEESDIKDNCNQRTVVADLMITKPDMWVISLKLIESC